MKKLLSMLMNQKVETIPLTVVGSPTIQDGVVSGFSSSDYLSVSIPVNFDTYELIANFNVSTINTQQAVIMGTYGQGSLGIEITSNNKVLFRVTFYDTNNAQKYKEIKTTQSITTNTWYSAKAYLNRITFEVSLYLYDNNGNLIESVNSSVFTNFSSWYNIVQLNVGYNFQRGIFAGEINIPKCSVAINGTKYIFTLP